MGNLVNKLVDCLTRMQVLELGCHGWGCHGGLLGGQREMQQLDQHEAAGIHHAGQKAAPKGGQRECHHAKFEQGGDSRQCAATRRLAKHVHVGGAVTRDVVLTRFSAALGHLGGQ